MQPFKRPFGLVRVGERQIARNISLRQPLLAALGALQGHVGLGDPGVRAFINASEPRGGERR